MARVSDAAWFRVYFLVVIAFVAVTSYLQSACSSGSSSGGYGQDCNAYGCYGYY